MGSSTSFLSGARHRATAPVWSAAADGVDDLESNLVRRSGSESRVGQGLVSMREHVAIVGNRVVHSRSYQWGYALLIAMSTFALVVLLTSPKSVRNPVMVVLDVIITCSLLVEVLLRLVTQGGRRFWADGGNRFDCAVCGLCVVTLALYVIDGPSPPGFAEQLVALLIVGARYAIQLARLMVLLRRYQQGTAAAASEIRLVDDSPSPMVSGAYDVGVAMPLLGPGYGLPKALTPDAILGSDELAASPRGLGRLSEATRQAEAMDAQLGKQLV